MAKPKRKATSARKGNTSNKKTRVSAQPSWDESFELLVAYKAEHGHTRVPWNYKTNGVHLGNWVRNQRKGRRGALKPLSDDRLTRLDGIGFDWHVLNTSWDTHFELLVDYKKEHGHTRVPRDYETNGKKLGQWVSRQRAFYWGKQENSSKANSSMTDERIACAASRPRELRSSCSTESPAREVIDLSEDDASPGTALAPDGFPAAVDGLGAARMPGNDGDDEVEGLAAAAAARRDKPPSAESNTKAAPVESSSVLRLAGRNSREDRMATGTQQSATSDAAPGADQTPFPQSNSVSWDVFLDDILCTRITLPGYTHERLVSVGSQVITEDGRTWVELELRFHTPGGGTRLDRAEEECVRVNVYGHGSPQRIRWVRANDRA